MKNVVPGDINIWAKTPTDEFDIEIKKDAMKEPFTFYVDFSAVSEEDEYRRHDDLERMVQSKLVTTEWARQQLPNVDPIAMERQEQKALIRYSQAYQTVLMQAAAGKLTQKLVGLQLATQPQPAQMVPQASQQPPQQMQTGGGQPQMPGRMSPNVPNIAPQGSPQMLQNQMRNNRSQAPIAPMQGNGGGGNRRA
jgi:hypothetical protein